MNEESNRPKMLRQSLQTSERVLPFIHDEHDRQVIEAGIRQLKKDIEELEKSQQNEPDEQGCQYHPPLGNRISTGGRSAFGNFGTPSGGA